MSATAEVIPPLWRIVTKSGYFAGLAAVMGSTVVHTAVLRPVLRDSADRAVLRRRSARVMAWSGVVLLVALYPQLAGKAARATDGMSFGTALDPSVVWDYLTVPAPGGEWVSPNFLVLVTYVLFFLSAILAIALFRSRHVDRITAITAPLIIVALVALAGARSKLSEAAGLIWARIWRRFSVVAEICVGIVVVSGLWLAWKSVGAPAQLWETPYGRVLLVKVTLVASLVVLGAVNEFVLLPRIGRLRAAGDTRSVFAVAAGHFPKVVAVEAVIGTAVLLVVPFLNGSAREQAGGAAEPPATGSLFAAVFLLLAFVVAAFFANRKLHNRIDNPRVGAPTVDEPELEVAT